MTEPLSFPESSSSGSTKNSNGRAAKNDVEHIL